MGGNEGEKCRYNVRLDTYGCGCQHNCAYCYARSLLQFRGLWDPSAPRVADIGKIRRKIPKLQKGAVIRLGGMTDCFQPLEEKYRVTYQTVECLNEYGIPYLIVTKSHLVGEPEYMALFRKDLAHIQVSVTCLDDRTAALYEHASPPGKRLEALKRLKEAGFDATLRLSPLVEELMDFGALNRMDTGRVLVEFLRASHWVKEAFPMADYGKYTYRQGGYVHLPLEEKIRIISRIRHPVTVCEDVTGHYEYWKRHVNPDPEDCCNLRT